MDFFCDFRKPRAANWPPQEELDRLKAAWLKRKKPTKCPPAYAVPVQGGDVMKPLPDARAKQASANAIAADKAVEYLRKHGKTQAAVLAEKAGVPAARLGIVLTPYQVAGKVARTTRQGIVYWTLTKIERNRK